MRDLGDRTEDSLIYFTFSTTDLTAVPTALLGSPAISVYKSDNVTQTTAGITLTTNFDSTTGLNMVKIDTSADAFYVTATDYTVVITAGTVDGISVVGTTLGSFSIENRLTPAQIWSNSSRTLTQSNAQIISGLDGEALTIHRGDTLTIEFTDLGDVSAYATLWFTIKMKRGDPLDSAALLMVRLSTGTATTDGLIYINGAAAETATNASITVDDASDGDLTITVKPAETAKLTPSSGRVYDVQMLKSDGTVTTLTSGNCTVTEDTTRATANA